jgi:hypothetical protein
MAAAYLSSWSRANVVLDGQNFSFSGHEYLREIYESHHPYTVIEKASQMGISTFALAKGIWACETRGMTVIYFFPTDADVADFSQARFGKMLGESPRLAALLRDSQEGKSADRIKLKKIRRGNLYFRGLFHQERSRQGRSGVRIKSVDADFLIFDELDEAQPRQKEAARHRVDHSRWRWILELSTPTVPGFGIDVEFDRSDQRFWHLRCPCCGHWNCLEDEFPRCLLRVSGEKVIVACARCRGELDPSSGQWVARYPLRDARRGYHVSQLYSTVVDPAEILDEYENPRTDMTLFYNHRLGLPYVDSSGRLMPEEVLTHCQSGLSMASLGCRCCMGVDQGRLLHVVVTTPHPSGKPALVYADTIDSFEALEGLMEQFDVQTCVIDALPNQHSARRFAASHPGRVYLCYYGEAQRGGAAWTEDTTRAGDAKVEVNRTESLDATLREIGKGGLLLPRRDRAVEEFARHVSALVRVRDEDMGTGAVRYRYLHLGEDHFAHARNYCRLAEEKRAESRPVQVRLGSPRTDWKRII